MLAVHMNAAFPNQEEFMVRLQARSQGKAGRKEDGCLLAFYAHDGFVPGRLQQLSRQLGLAGLRCQQSCLVDQIAQLRTTEAWCLSSQDCRTHC